MVSSAEPTTGGANPFAVLQPTKCSVIAEVMRCTASFGSRGSILQAMIGLALETAPWCAGSITMIVPNEMPCITSYLGRLAADCDALQLQLGEGPSHDVVLAEPTQIAGNLDLDRRWPRWSAQATALGIHAVMSLRLFTVTTVGTMNLYSARALRIDGSIAESAQVIAAHTSVILQHLVVEDHLKRAVATRTVIGQAQGMLMQRYGLTADGAFAVLQRLSQEHNIKIRALAQELAGTGNIRSVGLRLNK